MFEVANLEESDVAFGDAQVDVGDVLEHDDSIVAGSHLTKNVTREVSPIAGCRS